jgi:hypothetical protein
MPSMDRGVESFLWAIGLGLYIWAFMWAVGISNATAAIVAAVAAGGIFLVVRVYGDVEPRRSRPSRKRV